MPSKNKQVVTSAARVAKVVASKSVATKKVALKKPMAKPMVKSVAPVRRAAPAKAVVSHRPAPKAAVRKIVSAKVTPAPQIVKSAPHVHGKTVTHHRVVLYETCTNCQHMPDNIGSLLGMLSVLVAVLSGMLLSLAPMPEDWQNLVAHHSSPSSEQTFAQK